MLESKEYQIMEKSKIILGDTRDELKKLQKSSIQMCITSPPYWGTRDYGIKGQIGAENTLGEYITNLLAIFKEVKRIICNDGILWLNIGDTYTSGDRGWRAPDKKNPSRAMSFRPGTPEGLKPKDLIGVPWRLALALQEDGWYLRSDVIWNKPNAQPESVKDRPTRSHEYLFLFSKSEHYYYDNEAVKEPCNGGHTTRNKRTVWSIQTESKHPPHLAVFPPELVKDCILSGSKAGDNVLDPFMGSGTVGLVCKDTGRNFIGVEIKKEYVDVAIKRIEGEKMNKDAKTNEDIPYLEPSLQISFYVRLQTFRYSFLSEALTETVKNMKISEIDKELSEYVGQYDLAKLASFGLRGERFFPVPCVLRARPSLIGYYRLLFGLSKKEFYKSTISRFMDMEERNKITANLETDVERLCKSLVITGRLLLAAVSELDLRTLRDLQLLTLGAQLRGGQNTKLGKDAVAEVFSIINKLVHGGLIDESPQRLVIKNAAGREVIVVFSSDPDISVTEKMKTGTRHLVAIEIKGGKDVSNVYNRLGEAEKSHIKAKTKGFTECWTILGTDIDLTIAKQKSPTTDRFFHLSKLCISNSEECESFKDNFQSIVGIDTE